MIVSVNQPFTCPHCRADVDVDAAPVLGAGLARCAGCGFVYPRPPSAADRADDTILDLDDETWTDKWGPIRTDRFHVIRVLASGAQGRILLAHHRHLDQRCVIKLVATDDELWADVANKRLRNEAQAGVRVNHPNVARVLDCDCVDNGWYFVMEYIDGHNLRHVIRQAGRLPWQQVVDIGLQTAAGLGAIHDAGLIHRDVKPSNLMLKSDGAVKIMDLGLVKIPGAPGALNITHAGQVVGTPMYMPPEQFESGDHLDARADIYALGASLYHLLTGNPPFDGKDFKEIAARHRRDPVVWSSQDRENVPQWLRDLVAHCMAKRREHRIPSAADLEQALRMHEGTRQNVALDAPGTLDGVTVMAFRNLSRRKQDEWIGDAIAEYLTSRLAECRGAHVADRGTLRKIVDQTAGSTNDEPSRSQVLDAARLIGVGHVITGSFQCQGHDIRIMAQTLSSDTEGAKHLATVSGPIADLFALEDDLTDKIVDALDTDLKRAGRSLAGREKPGLEVYKQYVRGRKAFEEGDYHAAIEFARQALAMDPDYDEPVSLIGAGYARLGDYDRAVEYHQRQERQATSAGDDVSLAVALGNLGAMYYYKGDYAVAYDFLDRAASLSERNSPTPDTAKLYGNLGMVVMRLDKTEDAERAFERAIAICRQFKDVVSMVWPYNGMGSVLLKQGRYTEAREYHQRALTLAEEIGDRVAVGVSQMNIGRCACLTEDYPEAGIWFNAALGTLERTKFWNGLTLVYEHMAEMHLLGQHPAEALNCIDKRIHLAARHGNQRMESQAWEQKARAYEQMKRSDDALSALKKSLAVSQRPEPYESLHRYLDEITTRRPFA